MRGTSASEGLLDRGGPGYPPLLAAWKRVEVGFKPPGAVHDLWSRRRPGSTKHSRTVSSIRPLFGAASSYETVEIFFFPPAILPIALTSGSQERTG